MELYRSHKYLCTIWAFLEVVCFGGVIFGWGSLVFILKDEGFYLDVCQTSYDDVINTVMQNPIGITDVVSVVTIRPFTSVGTTNSTLNSGYVSSNVSIATNGSDVNNLSIHIKGCPEQESRLNLWFSIAVSFMYLSFTGIGYMVRTLGTFKTRLIFIIVYIIGTLCIAFATPALPWLLLPGLACIGTSGLVLLATNLQVANLHPKFRSTIVAIFTGLFDFSSIVKQLIKVAYEHGIARRYAYLAILAAYFVIVSISTIFFLPRMHIRVDDSSRKEVDRMEEEDNVNPTEDLLGERAVGNNNDNSPRKSVNVPEQQTTLCASLTSLTCVLHLYWLFVHALRFITFIGLLNVWLEDILDNDEEKVSSYIGIFSYMTMGSIGTALLCGFLYDWQRKKYMSCGPKKRVYMSVLLPMLLVIFYSTLTTILCYVRHEVTPYLAFAVFTFFRSSLFTVGVAFVGEAFPVEYFGVFFGFIQFAAGLAGLIQYPIFEWYDWYEGAYAHVNILLLALQLSTLIHPVILFIRGRKGDQIDMGRSPFNKELIVPDEKDTASL